MMDIYQLSIMRNIMNIIESSLRIKAAITRKYGIGGQWRFAKDLGVNESLVSKKVNGRRPVNTEAERKKWAELLDSTVEELFECQNI
jgi:hypothetical protein